VTGAKKRRVGIMTSEAKTKPYDRIALWVIPAVVAFFAAQRLA